MLSKLGDGLEGVDVKAVKGAIEVEVEVEILGANGVDADDRPNGVIGLDDVDKPKGEDIPLDAIGVEADDTFSDPDDTFSDVVPGISREPFCAKTVCSRGHNMKQRSIERWLLTSTSCWELDVERVRVCSRFDRGAPPARCQLSKLVPEGRRRSSRLNLGWNLGSKGGRA